jgi:hypothetical protein
MEQMKQIFEIPLFPKTSACGTSSNTLDCGTMGKTFPAKISIFECFSERQGIPPNRNHQRARLDNVTARNGNREANRPKANALTLFEGIHINVHAVPFCLVPRADRLGELRLVSVLAKHFRYDSHDALCRFFFEIAVKRGIGEN